MLLQGPKALYKADIDSAFRRIPIQPSHRRYARVVMQASGVVHAATHLTMMFGSIASVHAWHRVACLLRAIARRMLKIPVLLYVDDYFSIDREVNAESAMLIFARLVRVCLGGDAIANRKLKYGSPLVVLGIECAHDHIGATFWPAQEKVVQWRATIERFLASMHMTGGEASKLSGQLQWASQSAFRKLGRAMLRAIYDQIPTRSGAVSCELKLSLRWWHEVLDMDLKETRTWLGNVGEQVHLFTDARSTPPHIASVLFA